MASVEVSRYCEPGSGAGITDEVEDFGVTVERLGGPVFRDFGKQTMLDGIPFGSAGRIVSHGHCEPIPVAELGLKFGFQAPVRQLLLPPVSARMSNCRPRR